ncbi:uncharacterized protein LOC103491872 [Cucumis melo]|uniref:Uncharacterized protein LOC103491872 n=1 Tax=Cucumis melo TaxID=3656 RepID=A0ABM3KUT2_CUCME|nr:uncharacterized protein LOC103491872 [Cucumis melo]
MKAKARACLHTAVSPVIFNRLMALESAKEIWEFLKSEYEGGERIKGMKVLNLMREFERMQIKDSKSITEYSDKLIGIANKERALGRDLSDSRLVQKILVSVPKRYEATIASLENTKDLSKLKVIEVVSALQKQEQRRLMRQEGSIEGALKARMQQGEGGKEKKWKGNKGNGKSSMESLAKDVGSACKHYGKQNHPHFRCWRMPDVKCRRFYLLGHIERLCKAVTTQHGCTNHMTSYKDLFKDLDTSFKSRMKIGNGAYLEVKGKGTVSIESCAGTKLITEVLFVPEIDQNL